MAAFRLYLMIERSCLTSFAEQDVLCEVWFKEILKSPGGTSIAGSGYLRESRRWICGLLMLIMVPNKDNHSSTPSFTSIPRQTAAFLHSSPYLQLPTFVPGLRLYFRGSAAQVSSRPSSQALCSKKKGSRTPLRLPFLDMRVLSLVPLPPSQNPVPRFAISEAWQTPQSSGR
jgi:hypothetical protein